MCKICSPGKHSSISYRAPVFSPVTFRGDGAFLFFFVVFSVFNPPAYIITQHVGAPNHSCMRRVPGLRWFLRIILPNPFSLFKNPFVRAAPVEVVLVLVLAMKHTLDIFHSLFSFLALFLLFSMIVILFRPSVDISLDSYRKVLM